MVRARSFAALLALGAAAPAWGAVECDPVLLTAEDPQAGAQLGCSAFLHGDALFLGGHRDDSAGPDAGAVTPFRRGPGEHWTREPELTASDAGADSGEGAQFGFSASADGDWLAVGAPFADSGQNVDTGAVYLFQRVEGRWVERQKLTGPTRGGRFGQAAFMSGNTLLAGAPFADDAGSLSGTVFVFERSGNTWEARAKLLGSDTAPFDNFGFSVALDGDTAVVGAPFHDSRTTGGNSGAAYVFQRTAEGWRQSARLTADEGPEDQFGSAVSIFGATLAVGARGDDAGSLGDAGSVSIFERRDGDWTRTARFFGEAAGDQLGVSVSLMNGRLLAGARFHSAQGRGAGAAYLFVKGTNGWELEAKLPLPATTGDRFGHSLSADGNELLIGAYLDDPGSVVDAGSGTLCRIVPGVDPEPVVSIEKTNKVPEVVPGQTVTYKITVSHVSGPGTEVRVTDTFRPELEEISWCPPDAGSDCADPRGGDIDETIFLAPKSKAAVFTVKAKVAPNASGDLINKACATVPGEKPVCVRDVDLIRSSGEERVDLRLVKTPEGPAAAGGLLTYTLTVTNHGTAAATGIVLRDPPSGEELVNLEPVSASRAGCTRTEGGFSCALGGLAAGASRSARLTFRVLDTCASVVENRASVEANEPDPVLEDNSVSVTVPVLHKPPVLVFEKTGPDSASPEDVVSYTLRVRNAGPHRACGVLLEDPIPVGVTSPVVPPGCRMGEGVILCPVGDLPAGDARAFELDFTVLLHTCGSRIVNTARLTAEGADPQAATKETEIVCGPTGVSLVCADIDGSTLEGDAITYTFLLENHGPADQADNPGDEFSDLLPSGLTFVSAAATSGTITPGNPVLWNGAIPAGDTVTITITATIDAGTAGSTICNPASVSFDADGNGTNESSASTDAPCCFRVLTPEEIPTLGNPGLILLVLLVALAALRTVRKRGVIFRYK